jgi:hypothetical protein
MRNQRVKLKKMFVDKQGLHCFMLAGHEIFYNYFYSDIIHQVPLNLMKDRQVAFSSIDLLNFEDSQNFFELLLGST